MTQLTKDVILFQEKIEKLVSLFILNSDKSKSHLELYSNQEKYQYLTFSIHRWENDLEEKLSLYIPSYIQNKYNDEISKYKNYDLIFKCFYKKPHLGSYRDGIFFSYWVHPQLESFFSSQNSASRDSIFFNINRNQFYFKYMFLTIQKRLDINDIFDYLDDLIWILM